MRVKFMKLAKIISNGAIVLFSTVILAACANSANQELSKAGEKVYENQTVITINDFQFKPDHIKVEAGTEVVFRNNQPIAHAVTSMREPSFENIKVISSDGGEVARTFEKPGVYKFFCNYHPEMVGEIEVVASDNQKATNNDTTLNPFEQENKVKLQ